jgi:hypothetical protein
MLRASRYPCLAAVNLTLMSDVRHRLRRLGFRLTGEEDDDGERVMTLTP